MNVILLFFFINSYCLSKKFQLLTKLIDFKTPFDESYMKSSSLPTNNTQYHGTTTLSFKYHDGIIVAIDSRASIGSYVGSRTVKKIFPITNTIIGTMAGGAADCTYCLRQTETHVKKLEYQYGTTLKVIEVANVLSSIIQQYAASIEGICHYIITFHIYSYIFHRSQCIYNDSWS